MFHDVEQQKPIFRHVSLRIAVFEKHNSGMRYVVDLESLGLSLQQVMYPAYKRISHVSRVFYPWQ